MKIGDIVGDREPHAPVRPYAGMPSDPGCQPYAGGQGAQGGQPRADGVPRQPAVSAAMPQDAPGPMPSGDAGRGTDDLFERLDAIAGNRACSMVALALALLVIVGTGNLLVFLVMWLVPTPLIAGMVNKY